MQPYEQEISEQTNHSHHACSCGSGGCGSAETEYKHVIDGREVPGYFQLLQEGDYVLDLGCGTGIDTLDMAGVVGPKGKVIGIDFSDENLKYCREELDRRKIVNAEFRQGELTDIPVPKEFASIVIANCVFNLLEDRQKAADEMYRVCEHEGFVCVTDFAIIRDIPDGIREEAGKLMGCISRVEHVKSFMSYFQKTGFTKGEIVEVNKVALPTEMLEKYLSPDMVTSYNDPESDDGIFRVVLVVEKPETCNADTCCCNPDKHKN